MARRPGADGAARLHRLRPAAVPDRSARLRHRLRAGVPGADRRFAVPCGGWLTECHQEAARLAERDPDRCRFPRGRGSHLPRCARHVRGGIPLRCRAADRGVAPRGLRSIPSDGVPAAERSPCSVFPMSAPCSCGSRSRTWCSRHRRSGSSAASRFRCACATQSGALVAAAHGREPAANAPVRIAAWTPLTIWVGRRASGAWCPTARSSTRTGRRGCSR